LDWILNAKIDGKTPEEITKQILAIAPIVKGQKVSHEFDIPPPPALQDKVSQHSSHPPPPASGGGNDLIDFGDAPAAAPIPERNSSLNQPQSHHSGGGGLMDDNAHAAQGGQGSSRGLMEPLDPEGANPIKRTDTNTHEEDEFVDAEEKP